MTKLMTAVALRLVVVPAGVAVVLVPVVLVVSWLRALSREVTFLCAVVALVLGLTSLCISHELPEVQSRAICPSSLHL